MLLLTSWQKLQIPWRHLEMLFYDWVKGLTGTRPHQYRFRGPPHIILPHPHHHHHLDLPYSRTTQSHLHHHPQFSQPHRQGPLSYMVKLRLCHILLCPQHRLQMILRPALRRLSRGWGYCMSPMESWLGMDMMTCRLQLFRLSSACRTLRDTRGLGAFVFTCSCTILLCATIC